MASGATYGTDANGFTLPLYAGQTLSGAGSVVGGMSAQAGSTIALASSGSPTFADLTLADGAAIKIADDGAAALTATNLTVGANDVSRRGRPRRTTSASFPRIRSTCSRWSTARSGFRA